MRFVKGRVLDGVIKLVDARSGLMSALGMLMVGYVCPTARRGGTYDPVMGPLDVPLSGKFCSKFSELLVMFRKPPLSFVLIGTCVLK